MKKNERAQALEIIIDLLQKRQALAIPLQDPTLSPFTKTLCFGFARHYYRLDKIAMHLVKKRPKEHQVWICLLLGLLQIIVLHLPEYAVVQETVALLPRKYPWAKGFVNAILRRFCSEQTHILAALASVPEFETMHPEWFIKAMHDAWPQHWQTILHMNNQHPPLSLRVNLQRISFAAYCARLDAMQIAYQPLRYTQAGLMLMQACPVQEIPGFLEGEVSVQDGAAQLAGPLLALQPGLRVLDACCAPGGKLGHILELESELAACIGLDVDSLRLQRVYDNGRRLGFTCHLQQGDASQPHTWWDGQYFDRILLDAPCSATGIIRRHPDIKLLREREDIVAITKVQANILTALWPLLAPGGVLIYATCSIMPIENSEQIKHFLNYHPDAQLHLSPQPWAHSTDHGWQILPGDHHMDGFFYAKLVKNKP